VEQTIKKIKVAHFSVFYL